MSDTTQLPILDLQPQIEEHADAFMEAFQRVLHSGQFIGGPEVKSLEEEIASYLEVDHAISLNSGTDALVIALRALDIGPGDEVITTPFTFFATAEAISLVGATPVFVDVGEGTYNIDPARVEEAVTSKTRAILPVHLYGQPAAMTQIVEIAERNGLQIVEDCAQSFGARYQGDCLGCCGSHCDAAARQRLIGKMTGTIGAFGAYSFFPSKNLGAFGDGGLLATNDSDLAESAVKLRAHGGKHKYHNEMLGYNSRLDSLQAALLRVKLPYIDEANQARRDAAQYYTDALRDISFVSAPEVTDGHVFHQYTVRILDGHRSAVVKALDEAGIQSMVYYPVPVHRLPVYEEDGFPSMPVAEQLADEVLSLPIGPSLASSDQQRVVKAIVQCAAELRAGSQT